MDETLSPSSSFESLIFVWLWPPFNILKFYNYIGYRNLDTRQGLKTITSRLLVSALKIEISSSEIHEDRENYDDIKINIRPVYISFLFLKKTVKKKIFEILFFFLASPQKNKNGEKQIQRG